MAGHNSRDNWRSGRRSPVSVGSALARKQCPALQKVRVSLFHLRRDPSRLVYATWLVVRNLVGRIVFLRSMIAGQRLLEVGPVLEPGTTQHLLPNTRTSAHSRDIQRVREIHSWADGADLYLFLQGWNKGEEFAVQGFGRTSSCNEQTVASS